MPSAIWIRHSLPGWMIICALFGFMACDHDKPTETRRSADIAHVTGNAVHAGIPDGDPEAWRNLILAPHSGEGALDTSIRHHQALLKAAPASPARLERLGALFLAKARRIGDPAWAVRAEGCAYLLEAMGGDSSQALLLRGLSLLQAHRFREAEAAAIRLVARRGMAEDLGLLGDARLELGRTEEALAAYQDMLDKKPGFPAYARAARIRWIKGDLEGAEAAMSMALRAASPRDPESSAWASVQLGLLQWQQGRLGEALASAASALRLHPGYPQALYLRGSLLLAQGRAGDAVEPLSSAAAAPHPQALWIWTLREALEAAGRGKEADSLGRALEGPRYAADARGMAVYLATRSRNAALAVKFAERELAARGDIQTWDALAWSLRAAGRAEEACQALERVRPEGMRDARLSFHAGLILDACGRPEEAARHKELAASGRHMLLPSEWRQVRRTLHGNGPRGRFSRASRPGGAPQSNL